MNPHPRKARRTGEGMDGPILMVPGAKSAKSAKGAKGAKGAGRPAPSERI